MNSRITASIIGGSFLLVVGLLVFANFSILSGKRSTKDSDRAIENAISVSRSDTDDDNRVRNIAIFIHERVELLDFAGPGEVFAIARNKNGRRAFNVYTVAVTDEPITSQGFLKVVPEFTFANCPPPDILVLPGGATNIPAEDDRVMEWIKETVPKTEKTLSVCTGAYLLAKAKFLDGKKATTHWRAIRSLRDRFPKIEVVENQRYVDSGQTITSAGISAGIDASLYLVQTLLGVDSANQTARQMEYNWKADEE